MSMAKKVKENLDELKEKARSDLPKDPLNRFVVKTEEPIKSDNGVYCLTRDGVEKKICSVLTVKAKTFTKNGENYGRWLEWTTEEGFRHRQAIAMETVHSQSNEHIRYLASRGLRIECSRFAHQKLSEYIVDSNPTKNVVSTNKIGWNEDTYVMPEWTTKRRGDEFVFQSAFSSDHAFTTNGTLSDWQENISRFCVNNSRLVFAVSVAFASPLLSILQENGGGFHFRAPSSKGKSTALFVAGSVWGGGANQGFLNTWRATANGLEGIAQLHNDALLCLDELKECDPKTVGESAYMLANGRGKSRMTKYIAAQRSLSWNLLFLSSGELSLSSLIGQSGGRTYGGQEVRMCDIPADAEKGFGLFEDIHEFESAELFARQLTENSKRFYGLAIREFLENIVTQLDKVKGDWHNFRKSFMDSILKGDESSEVQRVAARFALVAYGGFLARDVCGWTENESIKACQIVFKDWLAGHQENGNADADKGVNQVKLFLENHGSGRFFDSDSIPEQKIFNQAGHKRRDENGDLEFLIYTETFKKEVCKGFDAKFIASELLKRGLLGNDEPKAKQVKIGGQNQRFYIVKIAIFASE